MFTLKAARMNKNYTQAEAAAKLGIGVDTLGKYERGETFPNIPILKKMEALYELEYKDIFFNVNYGITVNDNNETVTT